MREQWKKIPALIAGIYLSCELVKDFEFLVLKTDRTFLGENIFCKLFAIGVLFFCLKKRKLSFGEIGFRKAGILRGAVLGISLGVVTFSLSYLVEMLILRGMGLSLNCPSIFQAFRLRIRISPGYPCLLW